MPNDGRWTSQSKWSYEYGKYIRLDISTIISKIFIELVISICNK